jgi:hypothetical protein
MKRIRCGFCLVVTVVACAMNAEGQTLGDAAPPPIKEDDTPAPVDYGFGPGVVPNNNIQAMQEMTAAPDASVVGADARPRASSAHRSCGRSSRFTSSFYRTGA